MVDNVKKNPIVEQSSVAPVPTPSPKPEEYKPMFPTTGSSPAPATATEPSEAQNLASARSQAARAQNQKREVEQEKLMAEINKMLQADDKEATYENIVEFAQSMREALLEKQKQGELTQEEQAQLEALNTFLKPETPEATPDAPDAFDAAETEVTDEDKKLEDEINTRLKENNQEITQDNIIKMAESMLEELSAIELEGNLTPEQQKRLDALNKLLNPAPLDDENVNDVENFTPVPSQPSEMPVPEDKNGVIEKFLLGDIKKEDLSAYIQEYIEQNIPGYKDMSKAEQAAKARSLQQEIIKLSTDGKTNNYNKMTPAELTKAAEIIMLCRTKNISLAKFSELKSEQRTKMLGDFELGAIKSLVEKYTPKDIPPDKFKTYSPESKLNYYLDNLLASKYPEYSSWSEDDKRAKRNELIQNLVSNNLNIKKWDGLHDGEKAEFIRAFAKDLDVAITLNKPLSEVLSMDIGAKNDLRKQCAHKNGYNIDSADERLNSAIDACQKNGKNITYQNLEAELKKLADTGDPDAKRALERLKLSQEWGKFTASTEFDNSVQKFNDYVTNNGYKTNNDCIKDAIEKRNVEILTWAAAWAQSSPETWAEFKQMIEKGGFTPEEIRNIYRVSGQIMTYNLSSAAIDGNVAQFNHQQNILHSAGRLDIAENSIRHAYPYFQDQAFVDVSTNAMNVWGTQITPALTGCLNDRNIMTYDVAKELSGKIASSFDISGECRSSFATNLIKSANNTQEQLGYADNLSTISDPAVTEGLAAALQYVDSSAQNQYNSYIDRAIQNNGYSQEEINNINTARETGQTSYQRGTTSSANGNSPANSPSSASSPRNQASTTSSATPTTSAATPVSSTPANVVKVSPQNSNAVTEMRQTLAQLQYEESVAKKEKAMQDLQNIIEKIQNDQEVRAQKKAELAAKEAKTDEEIAQAIKETEKKSVKEQEDVQAKVAVEVVEELDQEEKLEKKFNISIDTINRIRTAARNGDLSTIYNVLGSISTDAQRHFVQRLSRKDTATIIGFIRSQSTNKSLIRELCRLNPGLIKALSPDLLISCGIQKSEIIKYADSKMLASYLAELQRTGNTRELNQFYEALGYDTQTIANFESKPIPGSDEWLTAYMPVKVSMRHYIDKHVPRKFWG